MAVFQYSGRSRQGQAVTGKLEASNQQAAAAQLVQNGITPIRLAQTSEGDASGGNDVLAALKQGMLEGGVKISDLIMFTRQMYTLTKAGIPMIRTINGLADTAKSPALGRALKEVAQALESGQGLASAMQMHPKIFSNLYVSLVHVGENTGRLEEAFERIAAYLDLEQETRRRVKSAIRYPMFVFVAIGGAIAVINIFVVPAFAGFFATFGADLPLPTRMLMASSAFTIAYWPFILVGMAAMVFGFLSYIRTENGRYNWHRAMLKFPLVGSIIERTVLSRFSRSFAMTMRSGISVNAALAVVARVVDNDYISKKVLSMRTALERGETLTRTAAATGMFTPLVLQMISVGEESGAIDTLLEEVADYYEREVDYDLKTLAEAIEPILIIIIGGLVLVLALAVYLPMWELAGAVTGK